MKNKKFDELIKKMSTCDKCLSLKNKNGKDCSLINIYKNEEFCKNIPSIWTDWYNRLETDIMIIGQDWGPYNEMNKFYTEYIKNKSKENWKKLIDSEKSLTKKMLEKYLIESALICNIKIDKNYIDKIFVTNAIMCARKGDNYRGDNIKLKTSTFNCSNNLLEQINIVKPKIILTLVYYPLFSLSKIFNFEIRKNLTETLKERNIIKINNYTIIPLYHPTAQIKKKFN